MSVYIYIYIPRVLLGRAGVLGRAQDHALAARVDVEARELDLRRPLAAQLQQVVHVALLVALVALVELRVREGGEEGPITEPWAALFV